MHRWLVVIGMVAMASCSVPGDDAPPEPALQQEPQRERDSCHIGGCSGQVCSGQDGVGTTCGWVEAYACYRTAICERQSNGACGWTPTEELNACLANHGQPP